jgi:nicotinamide riboside kinase
VGIVGPCVSGKSTLAHALNAAGYEARAISQEHSYVPHMWQRITGPDVLIYLDVDYAAAKARRPRIDWGPERLVQQADRLAHARAHCDLYLDTSTLDEAGVATKILSFLSTRSQASG